MKRNRYIPLTVAVSAVAMLFAGATVAQAVTVVDFDAATDIANNFRQTRVNVNTMNHVATAGSDGATAGFATFAPSADNNAIRYAYDANGAAAGISTFTTGFIAMDIRWTAENQIVGLFFAPTIADSLGWTMRLNNAGSFENGKAVFGVNNNNNFSSGTTLTTSSATAFDNPAGTPTFTTTTDTYSNVGGLTAGNWYSIRLDFGLNLSGERTLQYRLWDNILDGNGVGTGTLKWNQSLDIVGPNYSGAGEVGIFAFNAFSIDNLTVVAVPEPSTFALAGLGLAGLLIFRRRR